MQSYRCQDFFLFQKPSFLVQHFLTFSIFMIWRCVFQFEIQWPIKLLCIFRSFQMLPPLFSTYQLKYDIEINSSLYLSALDFWNIKFDELDFSLLQTWILQVTAGWKIQFKLGKKSSSSNWKFQSGEFEKSSSDR